MHWHPVDPSLDPILKNGVALEGEGESSNCVFFTVFDVVVTAVATAAAATVTALFVTALFVTAFIVVAAAGVIVYIPTCLHAGVQV